MDLAVLDSMLTLHLLQWLQLCIKEMSSGT